MAIENTPRWGSLKELCNRYPLQRTRAYAMLNEGRLRAKKFGKRTVWDLNSAEELFAALPDYDGEGASRG